jgi:outer membrane receptor protein involved in Fe transport
LANIFRSSVHSLWLGCAAALLTLPAQAQVATSTPETENAPLLEQVIITGSRIPVSSNLSSTSPIQAVSSQEIDMEGHSDTTDVLNELPQNIMNAAVDFGNHSNPLAETGGIATVDLRGLGPQRTLVLVDGRRLGVGDSSTSNPNPAPDIDQIPAALIERVEVVTGGASAVYGSDAMAGVVNFIMKKNFEGVEVGGQYSVFQHDNKEDAIQGLETANAIPPPTGSVLDGSNRDLSIIMGTNTNSGNGNITAYFTYHNASPVAGDPRDFSDCELGSISATAWDCENSSNSNRFTVVHPGGNSIRYTNVGNQFLPWPQAGSQPPAEFNSFSYEYLQREDERYNAGAFAHLDINDSIKPYLEVSFMNDKTNEVVAPTAIFNADNTLTPDNNYLINCSNPLLSAQEAGILCTPAQIAADKAAPGSVSADVQIGRRNIEGGGRNFYYEHNNYRIVGGIDGDLGSAWKYDAYAQYYYTSAYTDNQNIFGVQQVNNALQATGTAANPVCVSGGSCVPYNIFNQGAVTAQQLNYLYSPGTAYGTNVEEIVHADATGDLGKYGATSPFAHDGVAINIGAEDRFEALTFAPDETEISGNLLGEGALLPVAAGYRVREAFIEGRAPLAQNLPGVYDLSIDAGYRYSDYSTSAGRTNTYKFEVQYAPIEDFRLRYSYDRAVRAPNLIDLYLPQTYGQQEVQGTDPCAPTLSNSGAVIPATATLAQCARTGVTAAEYGNGGTTNTINQCVAGQCGQVLGGNPNLNPETADTYSLGITLTPTMVPGLNATIDYWHIALANVIGTIPENILFDGCLDGTNPGYCAEVKRTAAGSLTGASVAGGGYILQTSINTAAELVSGIDVQFNYRYPLPSGWGNLSTSFNGSWLQQDTTTEFVGAPTYDCAGLFGTTCGNTVNPKWRHNWRFNWDTPWRVLLSAQWRMIGKTAFDNNSNQPSLHFNEEGGYDIINAEIPNYSYLDLTAVVHVYQGLEVRAGVNNVFDKDPPVIPSADPITQNLNVFPVYDLLGRQLFVAFRAKF